MAKPGMRSSDRLLMRVALVLLVLVLGWVVLGWVLSALYTLVRIFLLLALLGVVAWFVLIGPPGGDD
jgi:uncharacterized membrane protein YbhN (UPF0104 family)